MSYDDDVVQMTGIMTEEVTSRKLLSSSAFEAYSLPSQKIKMKGFHGMAVSSESDSRVDNNRLDECGLESGFDRSEEGCTIFHGDAKEQLTEEEYSISQEKELPPFPWLAMISLCLGMLAHSVVFTNPLPYVAFMVVDFDMADNVDSAGYFAGWITGSFMIGKKSLV